MSETTGTASLLPQNADTSAFLDGAEVTIQSCRASSFDYNGTVTPAVPAIAVQFHNAEATKQPNLQHYAAGKATDRVASEDGKTFKVFGSKKGLPNDSNALKFIVSFINAGFPADKITDDVTVFEGAKVVLRSEMPERKGGDETKNKPILVVDRIVALPWENQAAAATKSAAKKTTATNKTTAAAPAAAAPAAAAGGADPLADDNARQAAIGAVLTILADDKIAKPVKKAQLGPLSFRILASDPNRNGATKLLSQLASDFLPTCADFFKFDAEKGEISANE